MKILHISYHQGCINDLSYILNKLGHEHETLSFSENDCQHYNMTESRATKYWNQYKDYFDKFDCIITSDTAPISRIFLQHNWSKKLIIWICNRFDYAHGSNSGFPDKCYYDLIQKATTLSNVYLVGYTEFENYYCKNVRKIDIGNMIIPPIGGISDIYNNFTDKPELNDTIFVPPYHNDTIMMNLSKKISELGIPNYTGKYNGPLDLKGYKGIIHIPYAWSNLALFENLCLNMIYFIPSKDFLLEIKKGRDFYWTPPFIADKLHLSEWYDPEHKDILIYFNSWDDLKYKINNINFEEQKKKIYDFFINHEKKQLEKWKKLIY